MSTLKRPLSFWVGRGMSVLVVLALLADAAVEFFATEKIANQMTATGFSVSQAPALGAIMLACAALYAIPRTAILGAILITGFFGGAICTHFRMGETLSVPVLLALVLGVMTWGGVYLRDHRLRELLPYRT